MDPQNLLKRLESGRNSWSILRSVARDIGHDLADASPSEIRDLAYGLGLSGGEPLDPILAGYRLALMDLLAAHDAERSVHPQR